MGIFPETKRKDVQEWIDKEFQDNSTVDIDEEDNYSYKKRLL